MARVEHTVHITVWTFDPDPDEVLEIFRRRCDSPELTMGEALPLIAVEMGGLMEEMVSLSLRGCGIAADEFTVKAYASAEVVDGEG